MNLDKSDQKILNLLYHNWRISISDISRRTRLSRRQVDYRIGRYYKEGIIRSFFTVVNYSKLGYCSVCYAFIKLKERSILEKVIADFNKSKRCISYGLVWTEYDLFSNWIFQSNEEKDSFFDKLQKRYTKHLEVKIVTPFHSEFYPLKTIDHSIKETYSLIHKQSSQIMLDNIDKKILTKLASDARISVVHLAKGVGVSPEVALYRLKRLKVRGVIIGSRMQMDILKSGNFATCLFLDCLNIQKHLPSLKTFCQVSKNINLLIVSEIFPKVIIQLFHKDEQTLRELILQLKTLIKDDLDTIRLVQLQDDLGIINPLPFL